MSRFPTVIAGISIIFAALGGAAIAAPDADPNAGDAAMGQKQFGQCGVCHNAQAGQPDKIGPNLFGVYGSMAGMRRPKFAYSPALKASKITWNDAALDRWLTDPGTVVHGTRMEFVGLPRKAVRQNIIAYLKTLK